MLQVYQKQNFENSDLHYNGFQILNRLDLDVPLVLQSSLEDNRTDQLFLYHYSLHYWGH